MQKWQNTSAGKIQCNRFNKAWSALNWEHNTYTQLSGVIGKSERSATLSCLGGSEKREDVTTAQEAIGTRFAWTVTAQNVNEIIKAIEEAHAAAVQNRPVHDERETADAVAERTAEYQRLEAERTAKAEESKRAFIAHYGSGETVTVQPGQMAVVAKICYDNSDSMSDYFDRHASLSQSFALVVVPKQAETERLARRGVAISSLLSSIDFEWHTEKYSMGHGNYLESGGFELPADLQNLRESYRSGGVTHAHWEITFTQAYRDPITLDAIAGYGQTPTGTDPAPTVSAVTITENEERNGIELRFPSKPEAAVLQSLKANGWRWSGNSQCWYTRRSDRARQFAESLTVGSKTTAAADAAPPRVASGKAIPDEVLDVLRQADIGADSVRLNGQLDRDLYVKVNKVLEAVGGKWSRGRKCHVFAQDPREVLGLNEGRTNPDGMSTAALEKAVQNGTAGRIVANLFPTPPELAARMVEIAEIGTGDSVLEPSAGTGNILRAIGDQANKTAVEIDPRLVETLARCGVSGLHIHQGDFLEQNGNLGKFDAVVMNPPFENGADIKHIRHALTFLKPGGRLVAICANGPKQNEQLKPLVEEHGGEWEELPPGTFKEQGTNVNTVLLSLTLIDWYAK